MTQENKKIAVAIDGYSSTGKSTMAKTLARAVGYTYIDTGAMYRATTLFALREGLIANGVVDATALEARLPDISITFAPPSHDDATAHTLLNGEDVEQQIRSMEVSGNVSIVAALPAVRRRLVALQQQMGRDKGVVMDGRDIGTVVLPDAELKVFVTADADVRALRRFNELRSKGDTTVTLDDVRRNVLERDHIDTTRSESPLRQAPDAVALDNSNLTADEQNAMLLALFQLRSKPHDTAR